MTFVYSIIQLVLTDFFLNSATICNSKGYHYKCTIYSHTLCRARIRIYYCTYNIENKWRTC